MINKIQIKTFSVYCDIIITVFGDRIYPQIKKEKVLFASAAIVVVIAVNSYDRISLLQWTTVLLTMEAQDLDCIMNILKSYGEEYFVNNKNSDKDSVALHGSAVSTKKGSNKKSED